MTATTTRSRILVLGGTGLIGTQVARAFLEAGSPVTVLARRPPTGVRATWLAGSDLVVGRADDPEVLARALGGAGHVVHALGAPPPARANDDPLAHQVAVLPALIAVLDALAERPGIGLTFLSSGGAVYGSGCPLPAVEDSVCRPVSAYGVAKLTAEHTIGMYVRVHGIPARVLRTANVYGPLQRAGTGQGLVASLLAAALTGSPVPVFGDGSAVRDYVEVSDVARAVVALSAVAGGPAVVNVGSGVGHSVNDVLALVERTTGSTLAVEWGRARPSDVDAIYLDTSRLAGLIDWRPTALADGVAATWDSWPAPGPLDVEQSA
jgi:UDP-glucose 4-epimerase